MKVLIDFHDPLSLPFPVAVKGQEDGVTGQFDFAVLVAPVGAFVGEEDVFENAEPDALILIRLEISHLILVFFLLLLHEYGVFLVHRFLVSLLFFKLVINFRVLHSIFQFSFVVA